MCGGGDCAPNTLYGRSIVDEQLLKDLQRAHTCEDVLITRKNVPLGRRDTEVRLGIMRRSIIIVIAAGLETPMGHLLGTASTWIVAPATDSLAHAQPCLPVSQYRPQTLRRTIFATGVIYTPYGSPHWFVI